MKPKQTFSLDIGWRALLKDFGLSTEFILRRAGLPDDILTRTEHGLTTDEYFRFWESIEVEAKDPLFPLRLVNTVSTESFSPPIFAALCSANLMQAVQRLAKYKPLVAPMSLEIEVATSGELKLSPRWLLANSKVPHSLEVAEIAFFARLVRLATRENVNAMSVTLTSHPVAPVTRRYEEFFGTSVKFSNTPCITFSAADALRPFLTRNESMWRAFEPDLRRRLSEIDVTASTAERVQALLLELLPGNTASVDTVANRLGISKRTLQRKLDDEGENFRALVSTTREKLARHYLANTSLPNGEIAFLLGFEDPNSFYRAFQEWTGQTPDTARHAMRLN